MLEAVNLHTRYGEVPAADKAAAVAWSLLKAITLDGGRIEAIQDPYGPSPGKPWRFGQMLPLRHPSFPCGPLEATMVYIPAGKHSRGGFDVHLDVEAGDVWRGTVLASDLASIAAQWIEVLPPETLMVYGFPAGPEPEALETDEFPAALGWLNWLSTRRWPGVARLATAREAFYRFEQTPTGVWLQLSRSLDAPPSPQLRSALRADLGLHVALRPGV